jgi:putative methionine-R-sulfoxide reductase with GAF domain
MISGMGARPYDVIAARLSVSGDRQQRMHTVVNALWEGLRDQGVSWVGFYVQRPGTSADEALELGPHRDKPACSPIGLHGVCGQALRFQRVRIVDDVSALGEDYVACDPRDRSEIALPLMDEHGECCWGVLDLDSWEQGAFDEDDERGLRTVLEAAGLKPA